MSHRNGFSTSAMMPNAERVRQLFELANVPFTLRAHSQRWREFGWHYTPSTDDAYGFAVDVGDSSSIRVDPLGERVLGEVLSFLFWEDYSPTWHKDRAEYERQRGAFDAEFDAAADLARSALPPPMAEWTDADADAHRSVIWRGDDGWLILQQAAFDVQFGMELNFWLAPAAEDGFQPTTPLIDYLCQLSRRAHDVGGFPPVTV